MAFIEANYDIEEWIRLEHDGLLQKVCKVFDVDGFLIEEYLTRVYIVPIGQPIPRLSNQLSQSAPSLYRAFSYDDEGNQIASIPAVKEWTQACEDAAQGALPGDPGDSGIPSGLKVAGCVYEYGEVSSVPVSATVVILTKTLLPDEAIYLRHIPFGGESIGKFQVFVNSSPIQTKRSWWTKWDGDFWFNTANGGILYENEEVIEIKVTNRGEGVADFESSIGFVIK